MKLKPILISSLLLFAPLVASASTIDASLNISGNFSTGSDSQFMVNLKNFQSLSGAVSVLTVSDTLAKDIKSAYFLDKTGWVKLTPYQNGSDVIAKFTSDTGFDSVAGRSISMRINFNTPKTYILGYTLQTTMGKVLSSAAAPITVNGKVLGESITAPITSASSGTFSRTLKYGSSGSDVTALQELLTSQGYYSGPITGFFGRQTQAAVKKYQTAHGISPANSVVGPATLSVLHAQ
jgi:hypothetical protein